MAAVAWGKGKKRQKSLAGLFEGSGEVGREASRMYIIIVRLTYVALERWPGVFGDEGRKERKQKCCRVCFVCLFQTWLLQWRGVCRVPCDSELVHPHKSIHRHALSLLTLACRTSARFLPLHTTLPSPSRSQNARPQLPKQAIIHKHSTPPPFLLLYVDPVPAMPSQPVTTSHPLTTPSIYPTKLTSSPRLPHHLHPLEAQKSPAASSFPTQPCRRRWPCTPAWPRSCRRGLGVECLCVSTYE